VKVLGYTWLLVVLYALQLAGQAQVEISSSARAVYLDVESNIEVTIDTALQSNTVTTQVLVDYTPSLTPNGDVTASRTQYVAPSLTTNIPYYLENTSRVVDSYTITSEFVSGFTPGDITFYLDANENGLADSGEVELVQPLTLQPDERIAIVAQTMIPLTLTEGENSVINVVATSQSDTAAVDSDNVVKLLYEGDVLPSILINAGKSLVSNGDDVCWDVLARQDGVGVLEPRSVIVDSSFVEGVLLSVALESPTGVALTLVSGSLSSAQMGVTYLYSVDGGTSWTSTAQVSPTHVGVIQLDGLELGEELSLSFCTTAENSTTENERVTLKAGLGFTTGSTGTTTEAISNTASVLLPTTLTADDFYIGPVSDPAASGVSDQVVSGGSFGTEVSPSFGFFGADYWFPISILNMTGADTAFELSGFPRVDDSIEFYAADQSTLLVDGDGDGLFDTDVITDGGSLDIWARMSLGDEDEAHLSEYETLVKVQSYVAGLAPISAGFDLTSLSFVGDGATNLIPSDDHWDLNLSFIDGATGADGSEIGVSLEISEVGGYDMTEVEISTDYQEWIGTLIDRDTKMALSSGSAFTLTLSDGGLLMGTIYYETNPDNASEARIRLMIPSFAGGMSATAEISFLQNGALADITTDNILALGASLAAAEHPNGVVASNEDTIDFNDAQLAITKTASRGQAEIGDPIRYTLTVQNVESSAAVSNLTVRDILPQGVLYMPNSAKLNGEVLATSYNRFDRTLEWELIGQNLASGESVVITYDTLLHETQARIVTNRAEVVSVIGVNTVTAADSADVVVSTGVFTRNSSLVGRVYVDHDQDGKFSATDKPMAGMVLQLTDGRQVKTDEDGKYHVSNILPGPGGVRLKKEFLPKGLRLAPLYYYERGTQNVRLYDVRFGELVNVDIRLIGAPVEIVNPTMSVKLEPEAEEKEYGILSPADQTLYKNRDQFTATFAYPLTAQPLIELNGEDLGDAYNGNKSIFPMKRKIIQEYVALPLQPGANELFVEYTPLRGEPVTESYTIHKVGEPHRITLAGEEEIYIADGLTPATIEVKVLDEFGQELGDGAILEARVSKGEIYTQDYRPEAQGHQLQLEDGRLSLRLSPAKYAEQRTLTLVLGEIEQEFIVQYRPLRDSWELTGVADYSPTMTRLERDYGVNEFAHISLLAQGPLDKKGKWQATVGYDSRRSLERNVDYGLLNQSEDDRYEVLGDQSQVTNPNASRDALYVRVESEDHNFIYGDIQTKLDGSLLARHDRKLTGGRARNQFSVGGASVQADSFIAKDDTNNFIERLAVSEVVGLWQLEGSGILANSESVVLELYERGRPDRLIKETAVTRGLDYSIDYTSGIVYFNKNFSAFDENLNPYVFRVTYETRTYGSSKLTYGTRVASEWKGLTVGTTYTVAQRDTVDETIYGIDLDYQVNDYLSLHTEWAQSNTYERARGQALLAHLDYQKDETSMSLRYYRMDEEFVNQFGSNVRPGVEGLTFIGSHQLSDRYQVVAEVEAERNTQTGLQQVRATTEVSKQLEKGRWSGSLGYYRGRLNGESEWVNTPIIGAEWASKIGKRLGYNIGGQYTVDHVGYNAPTEAYVGADWETGEGKSVGVKTLLQRDANDTWRPFLQVTGRQVVSDNLTYYSSYGQPSFTSNSLMGIIQGVNYVKALKKGLNVTVNLETNATVRESESRAEGSYEQGRDFTSGSIAIDWTSDDQRQRYRALGKSTTYADEVNSYLESELITAINNEAAVMARVRASHSSYDAGEDRLSVQGKLDLAYRPEGDSSLVFLGALETELNDGGTNASGQFDAHTLSMDAIWTGPDLGLEVSARYAAKMAYYESDWWLTDLKVLRAKYNLNAKVGLTAAGRWMSSYDLEEESVSLSVGLLYQLTEGAELELGYNFSGIESDSYISDHFNKRGAYFMFRLVFEEYWFKRLWDF